MIGGATFPKAMSAADAVDAIMVGGEMEGGRVVSPLWEDGECSEPVSRSLLGPVSAKENFLFMSLCHVNVAN